MSRANFEVLMGELTDFVAQQPLDAALAEKLNRERGPASLQFQSITEACQTAVSEGWMCDRHEGGIAYGRVLKPAPALHGFSVDVVDMGDVAGPHHTHPQGEIDLVMPLAGAPRVDGHGAGWVVYGPGSARRPTVTGGRALVHCGVTEFLVPMEPSKRSAARRGSQPRVDSLARAGTRRRALWAVSRGRAARRPSALLHCLAIDQLCLRQCAAHRVVWQHAIGARNSATPHHLLPAGAIEFTRAAA